MSTIPFVKAQATGNDFLVVDWQSLRKCGFAEGDLPRLARRLCERHYGVGADGVEILNPAGLERAGADAAIRLINSDGSEAEISGNGTRCVAAVLVIDRGAGETLRLATPAGIKTLRVVSRQETAVELDMTMGRPRYRTEELDCELATSSAVQRASLLDVGNPQCALFVADFNFDWRALGREIESLPRFPARTNVSFVRSVDRNTIEVRFWERGAGPTLSSGTGAAGAAAAAILTGRGDSPLRVLTEGGPLELRWEGDVVLRGPAVLVARGEFLV
jgi:diaminopimelate epimerase